MNSRMNFVWQTTLASGAVVLAMIAMLILGTTSRLQAAATTPLTANNSANHADDPTLVEAGNGRLPDEIAQVPGVSEDWWTAVQAQIRQDMYALTPDPAAGSGDAYRGYNPAQNLDFTFTAGGLTLTPGRPIADPAGRAIADDGSPAAAPPPEPPSWQWSLSLSSYGYQGNIVPTAPPTRMLADADRIEYLHNGLTEWYLNSERGLEHGFTLPTPPDGRKLESRETAVPLTLELTLTTDLVPQLSRDGQTLDFYLPGGNVSVLRYADLYVTDSSGKELPASLSLSPSQISILIDDTTAVYPLTIDPLIVTPGWTAVGENTGDLFGLSVGAAGDVNGDGYTDVIVGAPGWDDGAQLNAGTVYVYHGSPGGLSATADWEYPYGQNANGNYGRSVGAAGDVNGDGFDDIIIGEPYVSSNTGRVYIFDGSASGLNNSSPSIISGEAAGDLYGYSVGTAGDVNGDGFDDVIVGAHGSDSNGADAGKVYLYYGAPGGLNAAAAWTGRGNAASDYYGVAVGTAGDVNGDGYADIIIGAHGSNSNGINSGRAYLYLGSANGPGNFPNWTAGGEKVYDYFGYSVGTAGDVNGDGFDDVIIGAFGSNSNGIDSGKAYLYHGAANGLAASPNWTVSGENSWDRFGRSLGAAGDVNGDGYADVIVGASRDDSSNTGPGRVYLYRGSAEGLGETAAWTTVGEADGDYYGFSVGTAGDVNGDGFDDVIVGAHGSDSNGIDAGKAYLYLGPYLGVETLQDWDAAGENASDNFGQAVAAAGDVNGDGYADVLIGAPYNDDNGNDAGKAYLYYGSSLGLSATAGWSAASEAFGDHFAFSLGAAGDINDDGYDDILIGAPAHKTNGQVDAGKVYLFYGSATGPGTAPDWTAGGQYARDEFGYDLGAAGDVNGDGFADLIIGAPGYPAGSAYGQTVLFYGTADGPRTMPDWTATGEASGDRFGHAVATAGDVNGDGYADVIVGAPHVGAADAGKVYAFHGSAGGLSSQADWTAIGAVNYHNFGGDVAAAGDTNGDGYSDVIIGAFGNGSSGLSSYNVYVYYGAASGLGINSTGVMLDGLSGNGAVGTAGDINGDGYSDIVLGLAGPHGTTPGIYIYHGSAGGIGGTAAWSAPAERTGDRLGWAVGTAGDVNGDGYSDIVAGAPGYDLPAMANAGRVTVYHGRGDGLNGTAVWYPGGETSQDKFSYSISAGDVNGDGYTDILIGAPYNDDGGSDAGKAYLYYGLPTGPAASANWTAAGSYNGDWFGYAVSIAGDVNGDGYADILVGSPKENVWPYASPGAVHLYYGSPTGPAASADWQARGEAYYNQFGIHVSPAGDVNGDGYADFLVGATVYPFGPYQSADPPLGRVYLYYGSSTGPVFSEWTATGQPDSVLGQSFAGAGDINGDGYADILIGAPEDDEGGLNTGKVSLYYGSSSGPAATADWMATGESAGDYFGWSLDTAGDVNGDGYADVIVGAAYSANKVYIYHGSPLGLDVPFSRLTGVGNFGFSVSAAGDVNGDGYADVIIGAPTNSSNGKTYVYRGAALGIEPTPARIYTGESPGSNFGITVAAAGDTNGDGYADVLVGAPDLNTSTGKAYLYQGNNGGGRPSLTQQLRNDGSSLSVHPWNATYEPNSFVVSLQTANPMGRGRAKLQVQACLAGLPFGDAACRDITSAQWTPTDENGLINLSKVIQGLEKNSLYRWRARALFDSPFYSHTPWRRFQAQAQEADLRTGAPATDLYIRKTMVPTGALTLGQPLTYTIEFGALGAQAVGVVITDILPSSLLSVTVSSSGAPISDTGASPGHVWQVGTLAAGQTGVITITGIANEPRFLNTAVITATSRDSNPANNSATVQTHIPGLLFVAQNAPGPIRNGRSWTTAYTDLQDALSVAGSGEEIWVAEGVYKPTDTLTRTATFALADGVSLHGGFAGNEVYRSQRDWGAHPTILSGDIGTPNNSADNVYHVVSANLAGGGTVLDGFIITGGNADGSAADGRGGGLYLAAGSPTLRNLAFIGNAAMDGGGMYLAGSPSLTNVTFSGNTAVNQGGGIYNDSGSPTLINVTFSQNGADEGGGLYNASGAPTVSNSLFWGNTAAISGTQIYNGNIVNVTYSDVQNGWPGVSNLDADPVFYDADGADNIPGTLDDDVRLRHTSPVKDAGNNNALPADADDLDGDGVLTETVPYDLSGRSRLIGFTVITPTVDMGAYEANILDVLAEADVLLAGGISFRLDHLQLLPADNPVAALQNYSNFNDGEWYYDFCADYDQIDANGYCPENRPTHIRNDLLDTAALYQTAVNWPAETFDPARGEAFNVRQAGGQGVLAAASEIINDHLVFGNEFLVDATDYRFSTAGIPTADQIILQELDELQQARQHFELIMSLVFRAYNEWDVGQYTNGDQFEQFGVASSLMMSALDEIAARYYMLGQSDQALAVYDRAYREQNLQLMALAALAKEMDIDYLRNGSYEMFNNLSRMRARAQAIHDGLDFFGFAPDYAPLQSYDQLLRLTEGPTGNTGLLGTARDLEDQARDAQRTFDANASDMATELDNLTVELNNQLFDLCGQSQDDYATCEGGLMEQNLLELDTAARRIGLAWLRAQNLVEQIQTEEIRAGQVIQVNLGLGNSISAAELAIGKLEAERKTETQVSSSENQINLGVEAKVEAWIGYESGLFGPGASYGIRGTVTASAGYQHAWTWNNSTQTVWDPAAEEIAGYESVIALKQAEAQATIEGANSAAVVRNLLLQQSEALQEYEIAMAEFNKLAAEHNYLAEQHNRLLNRRGQAINRVANHNSHLLNPAYRIWRDSLTTQSLAAHGLAAQFAYLTARAAEYELLTPYPNLDDIFKARTANDIRLFLDNLQVWYQALDRPGQLNRYPYTISLAQDIWGLTDEALDPDGSLTQTELDRERYNQFQSLLQRYINGDQLEINFSTSLEQQRAQNQYLFSPNIWNNRIAGVGAPLAGNQGVWLNLMTKQTAVTGSPEVILIHGGASGGAEAYRNAAGETVYYDPGTAVPVGYVIPAELDPSNTTVVLRPGINGAGAIANGGLINLSVSAASWTLRVPADSRGSLDYSQLQDIEIYLDSAGRAIPGREAMATQDALLLQAGRPLPTLTDSQMSQLMMGRVSEAAAAVSPTPGTTPPAVPGNIGGSYYGAIVITSPITMGVQILNLDLWNNLNGVITGTINISETALYSGSIGLNGVAANGMFTLTADIFTSQVAGWPITQTFTLAGQMTADGDILTAAYTGVITNLLPTPTIIQGLFSASRPGTPGSRRLMMQAADNIVLLNTNTTITATLMDETMRPITATQRVTFTTNLGTLTPTVMDTVNGAASVTLDVGDTLGQVTIIATTGQITSVLRLGTKQSFIYYFPLMISGASAAADSAGNSQPFIAVENDRGIYGSRVSPTDRERRALPKQFAKSAAN